MEDGRGWCKGLDAGQRVDDHGAVMFVLFFKSNLGDLKHLGLICIPYYTPKKTGTVW
jgi:hypothetical protein